MPALGLFNHHTSTTDRPRCPIADFGKASYIDNRHDSLFVRNNLVFKQRLTYIKGVKGTKNRKPLLF